MVRDIVKDIAFLSQKAEEAIKEDLPIAQDLIDTLKANEDRCVGLAANMIGFNKSIICIAIGMYQKIMINPIITDRFGEYEAEEECLSLEGGPKKCVRYEEIELDYYDQNFNKIHRRYKGFTAEIIQHEIDHINGIII